MKIGVVIPASNAERFVADSLGSLRAQTCADWEAYVMDDGSRDGTLAAVRAFAAEDPRIHVLHHGEKAGLGRHDERVAEPAGRLRGPRRLP